MLKIFLKHCIFEICIKLLFDNIEKNFKAVSNEKEKLLQQYYNLMTRYTNNRGEAMVTYEYFRHEHRDLTELGLVVECASILEIMEGGIFMDDSFEDDF